MPRVVQQFLLAVALIILISAQLSIYSHNQPRISLGGGRGDDGISYGRVADAFLMGEHPVADAPFVYRVGVPYLASIVAKLTNLTIDESFKWINAIAVYMLTLLIYYLALQFMDPIFAFMVSALYTLPFYGYTRAVYFYPVLVDAPWMVLIIISLIIMTSKPQSHLYLGILAIITFIATLIRETGFLIPLTFILSNAPVSKLLSIEVFFGVNLYQLDNKRYYSNKTLLCYGVILFTTSLLAIYLTRYIATAANPHSYSFLSAINVMVHMVTLESWVLSAFLAFGGPLLSLFIIKPKLAIMHFRHNPTHMNFIVLTLILSLIGGVATVRFMSWASPLVLIPVCMILQAVIFEFPAQKDYFRKSMIAFMILGIVLFEIINIHPLDGYYSDYGALKKWGGIQRLSTPSSLLLFSYLTVTVLAVFLWRWFSIQPFNDSTSEDGDAHPPPQPVLPA